MDWPSDVTAFCSVVLSTFDKGGVSMKCGPYYRFANNGVDSGLSYYYDEASGKLLAVVHHQYVFETATCVGGPADFVEPMVCDTHDQLECPDGGDGGDGSPGDSGTD